MKAARLPLMLVALLLSVPAHAVTIDWVTVSDPGNMADSTGYGSVVDAFRMMKYEVTNAQYAAFLNAVAATDTYSLYNSSMGTDGRGGITQNGSSGSFTYSVRANMGDKPVNFVSWFDAARMANWLQNGQGAGGTEIGAYTLVGGQTSGVAPGLNSGATFWIPTENQWYKSAYYKAGSSSAGYWGYTTQSDTAPTTVTADPSGVGSAGGSGNFANFSSGAGWNGQNGNVTTVGSNGSPSAYGVFDMGGNVWEWNDLTGTADVSRGIRGGSWTNGDSALSSATNLSYDPSYADGGSGFRLASPVPVPEPSTYAMAFAGLACAGFLGRRRWKRA
jgi:formylglycine-generating enzyme